MCGAAGSRQKTLSRFIVVPDAAFGFQTVCGTQAVQFNDSSTAASSSISGWLWDFGDGQYATVTNPKHSYEIAGEYRVKLKIISSGICPREDTISALVMVKPKSPARLFLGIDTAICSQTFILHAGAGFKDYRWQDGSSDSIFVVTQPGKYFVYTNDYCGRFFSDTILIRQSSAVSIFLGNDTSICRNQPYILDAGNGFVNYLWNTGETYRYKKVDTAGVFWIHANNGFGCISTDTIEIIDAFAAPVISLNKNTTLCFNQNNLLNAGGGYSSYLWQDGGRDSIFKVIRPGFYKVTVGNAHHCYSSDSVQVTKVSAAPDNFLNSDSAVCSDEGLLIVPTKVFAQYLWSDGTLNDRLLITPPAVAWLKVMDQNNCWGIDTIKIFARDCSTYFNVPNSFTPNHDGLNDLFKPIISGRIEAYEFSVYNMYGQLIFSSHDMQAGWDGRFKGLLQNQTVFIWYCKYKAKGATAQFSKGTVLVLR